MMPKWPEAVDKIFKKVSEAGFEIYLVGGAVRDTIMGREVKDWDMTTSATPEELQKIFSKSCFYNNDFGTVSVVLGEEVVEVTTYRSEGEYEDFRHPGKVAWGKSLEEDVTRRDFTINALAMDQKGNIKDCVGGIIDIENKLIRAVGEPEGRFEEDGLRMMRAIRISCQIGFLIESATFEAISKKAKIIENISGERIRDELFKILATPVADDGFRLLKNSGILEVIMPEVLAGVNMGQKGHHIYDVWTHMLMALKNCLSSNPITRLATLLHDVGKPNSMVIRDGERTFHNHEVIGARIALGIAKRLKLSKKETDQLYRLVRWHMFTVGEMQTDKAVRRFIRNVTPEYLDEMIALRRGDRLGSGSKESSWRWELFKKRLVEVQKQPFAITDLKVDGKDVMEVLNIKPGRKVGEVLKALFALVEEDPSLNVRETLLEKIKQV
ncbi:MAG: HD domain-containing protein [Candidatus Shapirobacteria bacterium]